MFSVVYMACAGDPHASERIGPSCSRTQLAVSISHLVAALKGAQTADLSLIQVTVWFSCELDSVCLQERTRPLILRYHGRETLFDWMAQQVTEAIYQNRDVTPYPDFLQQRVSEGKVSI